MSVITDRMNRHRITAWLWRHRWPGLPLTIAVILTVAQYWYDPSQSQWIDKAIVGTMVLSLLRVWIVILRKTPRPWDEHSTGVFLFVTSDLLIYGIGSLAQYKLRPPYPEVWAYGFRTTILIGALVMLYAYRAERRRR